MVEIDDFAKANKLLEQHKLDIVHKHDAIDTDNEAEKNKAYEKATKLLAELNDRRIPVPIDVFPAPIQAFIAEQCAYHDQAPCYYLGAIMSVAGAAIGNSFVTKYMEGWEAAPLFWINLVGKSGISKSPPINMCVKPLTEIQHEIITRNEAIKKAKDDKSYNVFVFNAATVELVQVLFKNNPKGLLVQNGEGTGFLKAMGQYSNSSDAEVAKYNSFWDNFSEYSNGTKKDGAVALKHTFVNFLLGIQTGVVKELAGGDKAITGFFQRNLFCLSIDEKIPMPKFGEPNFEHYKNYKNAIRELYELPDLCTRDGMGNITEMHRCIIPMPENVKRIFHDYRVKNSIKKSNCDSEILASQLAKIETYVLRFAILLEMLDYIFKRDQYDKELVEMVEDGSYWLSEKSMKKAIKLANYFEQTAKYVTGKLEKTTDNLLPAQKSWYLSLPEEEGFTASFAIEVAEKLKTDKDAKGVSRGSIFTLLKDRNLFIRKGRFYEKLEIE